MGRQRPLKQKGETLEEGPRPSFETAVLLILIPAALASLGEWRAGHRGPAVDGVQVLNIVLNFSVPSVRLAGPKVAM